MKNRCAPAIWKKLNPEQRTFWLRFYSEFTNGEYWPTGYDGEDHDSQQLRHVIGSNLSTVAVYELNGKLEDKE